jgi:spoIIIJ-associated protein
VELVELVEQVEQVGRVAPVREVERSAPSVEEAIELALNELGASEQEVSVQILQDPRSGFLGVGGQDAVVRVRVTGEAAAELADEELEEQGDIAADFIEGVVSRLGIEAEVETVFRDGAMYVEILPGQTDDAGRDDEDEDDMGLLIGRHGQTLEALQDLARTVVGNRTGARARIVVDAEDYRKRQRSRLEGHARDVARRVARSGAEEALDPMNAYERKIVHDAVAAIRGVETTSRGEEPDRRVVIRPTS